MRALREACRHAARAVAGPGFRGAAPAHCASELAAAVAKSAPFDIYRPEGLKGTPPRVDAVHAARERAPTASVAPTGARGARGALCCDRHAARAQSPQAVVRLQLSGRLQVCVALRRATAHARQSRRTRRLLSPLRLQLCSSAARGRVSQLRRIARISLRAANPALLARHEEGCQGGAGPAPHGQRHRSGARERGRLRDLSRV